MGLPVTFEEVARAKAAVTLLDQVEREHIARHGSIMDAWDRVGNQFNGPFGVAKDAWEIATRTASGLAEALDPEGAADPEGLLAADELEHPNVVPDLMRLICAEAAAAERRLFSEHLRGTLIDTLTTDGPAAVSVDPVSAYLAGVGRRFREGFSLDAALARAADSLDDCQANVRDSIGRTALTHLGAAVESTAGSVPDPIAWLREREVGRHRWVESVLERAYDLAHDAFVATLRRTAESLHPSVAGNEGAANGGSPPAIRTASAPVPDNRLGPSAGVPSRPAQTVD